MLDKQDLQAIKELVDTSITTAIIASEQRTDAKLAAMEQRTDAKLAALEERVTAKIKESSEETMRGAAILMEQYFQPRFSILDEKVDLILEKLDGKVDREDCENGMSVVAAAVRAHSRDIEELKAQ